MIEVHLIYDEDDTAMKWGKNLALLLKTEVLCIVLSTDIEASKYS